MWDGIRTCPKCLGVDYADIFHGQNIQTLPVETQNLFRYIVSRRRLRPCYLKYQVFSSSKASSTSTPQADPRSRLLQQTFVQPQVSQSDITALRNAVRSVEDRCELYHGEQASMCHASHSDLKSWTIDQDHTRDPIRSRKQSNKQGMRHTTASYSSYCI